MGGYIILGTIVGSDYYIAPTTDGQLRDLLLIVVDYSYRARVGA